MIGDLLLTWMSETGAGTVTDFRSRAAWLARTENLAVPDSATGRWLRDASSLGYCEVDWKHGRWSAAPPVIARLPLADGMAVLTGARRPRLIRAIGEAGIYTETVTRPGSDAEIPPPATILVPFEHPGELDNSASVIGARYAGCAASTIASMLTSAAPDVPAAPPAYDSPLEALAGFSPRRWDAASARDSALSDGLYREHVNGRWRYALHRGGSWYACDLSAGIFAELARTGETVIRWRPDGLDNRTGTVFVDWGAPLPPLQSRALALCSGFAPRFGTAAETAIYDNVPRDVAARVASSLGQALQTSS